MRIRSILLNGVFLMVLAGGCVAAVQAVAPEAEQVVSVAVPLDSGRPEADAAGSLIFRGAIEIGGVDGLGGLSGLSVTPDGRRFTAIGDTGDVVSGRLDYDAAGRLSGAGGVSVRPLPIEAGVSRKKKHTDAEDLVRLPEGEGGGGWLVSLERNHRILWYSGGPDGPRGTPVRVPVPPGVEKDAPENGGLESLARLADGRLLTIEEGEESAVRERRAWVSASPFDPRRDTARMGWLPLTYRAAPRYRPVGAAGLPDGGAVVLERRVSLLGGWSSRLVRVPAAALRAGAVIDGEELVRLERPLLNDNFEGVAVRRGSQGEVLVYLVSDDNFSSLQRTYLVMFALPPGPVAVRP